MERKSNRPYKGGNKEWLELSKSLYGYEGEKGISRKIISVYKTTKDFINLTFRPYKWIEENSGLSEEEIINRVDKYELVASGIAGSVIAISTLLAYDKNMYNKDKLAHMMKGYITALIAGRGYRFMGRKMGWNENNQKFCESGAATAQGIIWEYKDSITGGIVDPADPVFDVVGGVIKSLITWYYQRIKIELLSELLKNRK